MVRGAEVSVAYASADADRYSRHAGMPEEHLGALPGIRVRFHPAELRVVFTELNRIDSQFGKERGSCFDNEQLGKGSRGCRR